MLSYCLFVRIPGVCSGLVCGGVGVDVFFRGGIYSEGNFFSDVG